MSTHATIRKVLQTLIASFFAACLLAAWPLSAQAGKSGGGGGSNSGRVSHQDLKIQKQFDQASPKIYDKTNTGKHFDQAAITTRKSGGSSGGTVKAGWNLAQNKKAARTTGGTKGNQQYIKYDLKNTYISN